MNLNERNQLKNGIFLDSAIFISYDLTKEEALKKLQNTEFKISHDFPNWYGITVCSRIFGSEEPFLITFDYLRGRLDSIAIREKTPERDTKAAFRKMQDFLEFRLGKPARITGIFAGRIYRKKEGHYKWKIGKVCIYHDLIRDIGSNVFLLVNKNKTYV